MDFHTFKNNNEYSIKVGGKVYLTYKGLLQTANAKKSEHPLERLHTINCVRHCVTTRYDNTRFLAENLKGEKIVNIRNFILETKDIKKIYDYGIRKFTPLECFELMGFTSVDYDNALINYHNLNKKGEFKMDKIVEYQVCTIDSEDFDLLLARFKTKEEALLFCESTTFKYKEYKKGDYSLTLGDVFIVPIYEENVEEVQQKPKLKFYKDGTHNNGIMSDSQLYKMAGNSIVVNVLEYIYEDWIGLDNLNAINVLSTFSGIGAFEKALTNLNINYNLLDYVEYDKYAALGYARIHNVEYKCQDITTYDKDFDKVDLFTYGFPCQDISNAGKQAGAEKGSNTRSSLGWTAIDLIKKYKPKYAIMENVKNLLGANHLPTFIDMLKELEENGYKHKHETGYYSYKDFIIDETKTKTSENKRIKELKNKIILNAKDYGIPQNRERVFVLSERT